MKYFKTVGMLLVCMAVVGCGRKGDTEENNKAASEASAPRAEVSNAGLEAKVTKLIDLASSLPVPPEVIVVSCSNNKGQYIVQYSKGSYRITTDVPCVEREDSFVLKLTLDVSYTRGTLFSYKFYEEDYMKVYGVSSPILNPEVFMRVMQVAERRRLVAQGSNVDLKAIQYVDDQGKILISSDNLLMYGSSTTRATNQQESNPPVANVSDSDVSVKTVAHEPAAKVEASAVVVDKDKVNNNITSN